MEDLPQLRVPITCGIEIGKNWGEMEEAADTEDAYRIFKEMMA